MALDAIKVFGRSATGGSGNHIYNQETSNTLNGHGAVLKGLAEGLMSEILSGGNVDRLDLKDGIDMAREVRSYECYLILSALRMAGGHQKRAARMLGLKPTTLNSKIKRYKIDV